MRRSLALALALAQSLFCLAAATADGVDFGLAGVRRKWYVVPTGIDVAASYRLPPLFDGRDTLLCAKAGGGYEDRRLFRDPASREPLDPEADEIEYIWADFQWDLAFVQGLAPKASGGNLLEAFAYYRGRFDRILEGADRTPGFEDWDGLFYTGVMAGLSWNALDHDGHGVRSGLYAEASFEWGPGFLNELADFWRADAKLSTALPLFDLPGERNVLSGYLADFIQADYADGSRIPAYVNQTFGGRELRDSLGASVRGYAQSSYDTKLKLVHNLELRVNGPAVWSAKLYPVAYFFLDSGYYAGYSGASDASDDSGFLASVGCGLAGNFLDIAQVGLAIARPLLEKSSLWWDLRLFLHF